ncbi:MAG: hypothetical protein KBE04_10125 [Phycisphaerae bacterium]|nr:hypothetical protein [Phycisphaerae bacterium]
MRAMMSVSLLVVVLGFACPASCTGSYGGVVVPTVAPTPEPIAVQAPPTEEQMARLQEQMAELQTRAAQVAEKRAVASSSTGFGGGYGGNIFGVSYKEVDRAWIVPSGEMKPDDMASIQEDMAVMSRILDKALDQADVGRAETGVFIGYELMMGGYGGAPSMPTGRSMFLAGYGALFRIDVDFPLAGPVEQPKQEPAVDKDPTWSQARREIYEPDSEDSKRDDKDQYRPEKVDALKKALIESLRHASNIRALQATDKVVILVSGRTKGSSGPVFNYLESGNTKRKLVLTTGTATHGHATTGGSPATTLVMQARKSDIDALAAGTLTLEQLQQKVLMTSY